MVELLTTQNNVNVSHAKQVVANILLIGGEVGAYIEIITEIRYLELFEENIEVMHNVKS